VNRHKEYEQPVTLEFRASRGLELINLFMIKWMIN
jgi:hypothetical protein